MYQQPMYENKTEYNEAPKNTGAYGNNARPVRDRIASYGCGKCLQDSSNQSDSYNTFVFVVADIPICLLPASTPNDTGCTFLSDSYCSCMVNGHFFTTFAIPDFNIRQTFPCRSVGINGCPSFATTYTMIQVPFFWCVTAVSRTHLP